MEESSIRRQRCHVIKRETILHYIVNSDILNSIFLMTDPNEIAVAIQV